ncbi:helix-turn-helix domain-containing protein [Endozoicomonas montiporae]|uniref:XRE family transcriptional regulator n=1 Tax=Endozoicomonas montiporae CL-33 TaxID=570277 RepID=A0A142BHK4_9GAMM|nr:helix-turn-helix transcriptional regulator [Endozoicomonas montiporae]AMO58230.1 XRE family transcriptional regulator [Endozoicomonas montiporae CL-33]
MSTLGERLKAVRKQRGLTQAALADRVGARQGNINDIESGRNKSSKYLLALADVLNVDARWLERGIGQIRGVGVDVVNQGAPLPLYDMDTIKQLALDPNFEPVMIDQLYRCPTEHSDKAYSIQLVTPLYNFSAGCVLFVDPAGSYQNNDYVVCVFPDSGLVDIRQLATDGNASFIRNLDLSMPNEKRLLEVKIQVFPGGTLAIPQTTSTDSKTVILAGRIIFSGYRYN